PVDPRGGRVVACTTSNAWPAVDTLWTGYFLLNIAALASAKEEDLKQRNLDRGAGIALNVGLVALAVTSAAVGFTRVGECKEQPPNNGRGYPQRLIAPPRATQRQEEAEEEAAVQAQMRVTA